MQAAIAHRDYLRAVNAGSETLADSLQAADAGTLVTWDPAVGVVRAGKGEAARDCLDYRTAATLPDTTSHAIFAHDPDMIDSWRCILESRWTTRAWTTQEFVAGPDVLMQLGRGEVTITLDDLDNLARYLYYDKIWDVSESSLASGSVPKLGGPSGAYLHLVSAKTVACKVFWMIFLRRSPREGDESMSIGEVLSFIRGNSTAAVLNTRDARDVLWSLLALTRDRAVPELQPDYDLSTDEVYRRFSIHIATAEAFSFSMLMSVPLQMQTTDTPSWTVAPALEVSRGIMLNYLQTRDLPVGFWATANEQGTELTVLGTLVDRIDRLVDRGEIDARWTADDGYNEILCLSTAFHNTEEVASWPGLFVLPGESPEEAKFKFLRGLARGSPPSDMHGAVFKASWEQYARLWSMTALACLSRNIPTLAGERGLATSDEIVDLPFFQLVREKGWPMDMVRHYSKSDASEASGFRPPGELTTETACLAAMRVFIDTVIEHCFKCVPYWQGKAAGMTSRGHLCNVDKEARVGDWIAMTAHHPTALVLREAPGGAYSLVGQAYAHGLMEGMEMFGDVEEEIRLC